MFSKPKIDFLARQRLEKVTARIIGENTKGIAYRALVLRIQKTIAIGQICVLFFQQPARQ
jgi:hypothetical protein